MPSSCSHLKVSTQHDYTRKLGDTVPPARAILHPKNRGNTNPGIVIKIDLNDRFLAHFKADGSDEWSSDGDNEDEDEDGEANGDGDKDDDSDGDVARSLVKSEAGAQPKAGCGSSGSHNGGGNADQKKRRAEGDSEAAMKKLKSELAKEQQKNSELRKLGGRGLTRAHAPPPPNPAAGEVIEISDDDEPSPATGGCGGGGGDPDAAAMAAAAATAAAACPGDDDDADSAGMALTAAAAAAARGNGDGGGGGDDDAGADPARNAAAVAVAAGALEKKEAAQTACEAGIENRGPPAQRVKHRDDRRQTDRKIKSESSSKPTDNAVAQAGYGSSRR